MTVTLTVSEVAKMIGVSTATIYQMAREDQIPHIRIRGRVLFHKDVVNSWLRGETAQKA